MSKKPNLYNLTKHLYTTETQQGIERDTLGPITQQNDTSYSYDALDRLTQAGNTTFTYDKAGNNLHNNATYHTKNNQLLEDDSCTYTYDKRGNLKDEKRLIDNNCLLSIETAKEHPKTNLKKLGKDRLYGYEKLQKNLEENEEYVKFSALRYATYANTETAGGVGQLAINIFIGKVINKGAAFPISVIALSGNGIYGIETINQYTDRIIENKDELESRKRNGTLTEEYLNDLFYGIKDK